MGLSLWSLKYQDIMSRFPSAPSVLSNEKNTSVIPLQPLLGDSPLKGNQAQIHGAHSNMEAIVRNDLSRHQSMLENCFKQIKTGRKALKEFIYDPAANFPVILDENFPDLSKKDLNFRKALALRTATECPAILAVAFPAFKLQMADEEFRKALVLMLSQKDDLAPLLTIKLSNALTRGKFEIEKARRKRAQDFLAPLVTLNKFDQFGIHDLGFIDELGFSLKSKGYELKAFIDHVKKDFLDTQQLTEQKWKWYSALLSGPHLKEIQQPVGHQVFCSRQLEDLFGTKDLFDPALHAPIPPEIKDLNEQVQQQRDGTDKMAHAELSNWVSYTAGAFLNQTIPERKSAHFRAHLNAIRQFHSTHSRYGLSQQLSQAIDQKDGTTQDYFAFSDQFKSHGKLFSLALYPLLKNDGISSAEANRFIELLGKEKYKKSSEQLRTVTCLLSLAEAKKMSLEERCRLLKTCLPAQGVENPTQALDNALQNMAFLVDLSEIDSDLGKACLARLKVCQTPADIAELIDALLPHVFSIAHGQEKVFKAQLEKFNAQCRFPSGLLKFAGKIQGLGDSQKAEMIEPFARMVNELLFPDQAAFKKRRYDSSASEHIRLLHEIAPEKFKLWQNEIASSRISLANKFPIVDIDTIAHLDKQVTVDNLPVLRQVMDEKITISDALNSKLPSLTPQEKSLIHLVRVSRSKRSVREQMRYLDTSIALSSGNILTELEMLKRLFVANGRNEKFKNVTVGMSDAPMDLAFFNVEVHNCQDFVTGDIDDCKAVLNEFHNGAELPMMAWDENGKIIAHRTVKVLMDCSGEMPVPVLHEEMQYPKRGESQGLPKEISDALHDSIVQIAKQLGWPLTTTDETLKSSKDYPNPVESLGSPAPYAYSDSLEYANNYEDDQGMTNGKYVIPKVRMVDI